MSISFGFELGDQLVEPSVTPLLSGSVASGFYCFFANHFYQPFIRSQIPTKPISDNLLCVVSL
jgi:hypothetical protein